MDELISRNVLLKSMGLTDAVKYGNKDAEQQYRSYSTWMSYEIADAIWDAPADNRWIPCSDALPASICRVLVTTFAGNVGVAVFNPEKKRWYKNGEFYDLRLIIAWQPMPDAYEPTKEDEA